MSFDVKTRSALVRAGLFCALLIAFLFVNWPFLMPLIIAGIFALGLQDFVLNISSRTRIRRRVWAVLTLSACIAAFIIPLALAIYRIVVYLSQPDFFQTGPLLEQGNKLKDFALNGLNQLSELAGYDLSTPARSLMENSLQKTGAILVAFSSNFLTELPNIFMALLVFITALFVLLLKAAEVKEFVLKYSPLQPELTRPMIEVTKRACAATLFSTFFIGLVQALVVGIGSLIFSVGDFWLILIITFFVSFIPVIGAAPVGFVVALLAYMGGNTGAAIGMAIIAIVSGTIDNVLKPFIVSKDQDVSAVIGFTAVVGAIIMMGLPGLLVGPVVLNLFVGLSPLLLKEETPSEGKN